MGSNFLRKYYYCHLQTYETRLLVTHVGNFTAQAKSLATHQQWRAYARFPSQLSKTRVPNTLSPPSRSFSSSSSSKSGFLGWYLGNLQSRPLITKCITSSLIYVASDLTSQVGDLGPSKPTHIASFLGMAPTFPLNTYAACSGCMRNVGAWSYVVYAVIIDFSVTVIVVALLVAYGMMITLPPSGSFDTTRTFRMAAYGLVILGPSQHFWFNSLSKILPKRDVLTTLKKTSMGQTIYGPIITTIFFSYNAGLQGRSSPVGLLPIYGFGLPLILESPMFGWREIGGKEQVLFRLNQLANH
uniref:Uncharacterized protein n=1 Tax=Quercus lobata TaxID=97700 RepID=A0A7N2N661_QUELO